MLKFHMLQLLRHKIHKSYVFSLFVVTTSVLTANAPPPLPNLSGDELEGSARPKVCSIFREFLKEKVLVKGCNRQLLHLGTRFPEDS